MKQAKTKISITDEYFNYYERYTLKYGSNTIVLLEVGSFYEMYSNPINNKGPDLYKISEILNLVVTRKDKTIPLSDTNVLMSGLPNHAISKFLKLLIDNNYTVVIFNQQKTADGVSRTLEGIYSPSTFIDNITSENKYLMTLYIEHNNLLNSSKSNISKSNISIGMCAVDSTTNQVFWYEIHGSGVMSENEVWEETQRFYHFFRPIELIIYDINNTNITISESKNKLEEKIDILPNQIMLNYNKINPAFTKIKYQNTLLQKIYPNSKSMDTTPIEFLNLEKFPYAVIALVNSFEYIHQHNEHLIKNLKQPIFFNEHKYMILGNNAQYQLNIIDYYNWDKIDSKFHSLNAVVNNCSTAMGKRNLKHRLCAPFTDIAKINSYYDLTEKMLNLKIWEQVISHLKEISDLDKFIQPSELFSIIDSFLNFVRIIEFLSETQFKKDFFKLISKSSVKKFINSINFIEERFQINKLKQSNLTDIKESFYKKNIYPDLDKIEDNIQNSIGLIEKIACAIENIQSDITLNIKHNDRDGYYLNTTKIRGVKLEKELEKQNKNIKIGDKEISFSDLNFTYQTNTCKITYNGLSDHSDQIDELYSLLNQKIKEYFYSDTIGWYNDYSEVFAEIIHTITELDLVTNNAFTSSKFHYVKPVIGETSTNSYIKANNLRHPIIERIIDYEYVPHDVLLDDNNLGNMIYGVNSCGKSSLMKAIGLNLIMAQCGLYVSAENFEFGVFDSLYTRISGNDNLFKGHSSFIIEMNELRTILKRANSKSLIIGDEICRGTEYLSANAIVASSILKLVDLGAKFLFATHLHELIDIEKIKLLDKIKFYHLSVEKVGDELIFNRQLVEGTGEQIYGITIAQYILNDPIFINTAIELKNELLGKSGVNTKLVNDKKSLYNKNIYMDSCSICGSENKLESHHINWQKDFSNTVNGEINKKKSHIIKDSTANLVVLCDKCHDNLHSGNFTINSRVKSSSGIKIV